MLEPARNTHHLHESSTGGKYEIDCIHVPATVQVYSRTIRSVGDFVKQRGARTMVRFITLSFEETSLSCACRWSARNPGNEFLGHDVHFHRRRDPRLRSKAGRVTELQEERYQTLALPRLFQVMIPLSFPTQSPENKTKIQRQRTHPSHIPLAKNRGVCPLFLMTRHSWRKR